MRTFERERLAEALLSLPSSRRSFFGASLSDRLLHRAREVRGNADSIRTLTRIQAAIWETGSADTGLSRLVEECSELIRDEDELGEDYPPIEDSAVCATYYCLLFLQDDDVMELVRAAERAYEAVDHLAHTDLDADFNDAEAMREVAEHPVVQNELAWIADDISLLGNEAYNPLALRDRTAQRLSQNTRPTARR